MQSIGCWIIWICSFGLCNLFPSTPASNESNERETNAPNPPETLVNPERSNTPEPVTNQDVSNIPETSANTQTSTPETVTETDTSSTESLTGPPVQSNAETARAHLQAEIRGLAERYPGDKIVYKLLEKIRSISFDDFDAAEAFTKEVTTANQSTVNELFNELRSNPDYPISEEIDLRVLTSTFFLFMHKREPSLLDHQYYTFAFLGSPIEDSTSIEIEKYKNAILGMLPEDKALFSQIVKLFGDYLSHFEDESLLQEMLNTFGRPLTGPLKERPLFIDRPFSVERLLTAEGGSNRSNIFFNQEEKERRLRDRNNQVINAVKIIIEHRAEIFEQDS